MNPAIGIVCRVFPSYSNAIKAMIMNFTFLCLHHSGKAKISVIVASNRRLKALYLISVHDGCCILLFYNLIFEMYLRIGISLVY
jgi:hypothetical protein